MSDDAVLDRLMRANAETFAAQDEVARLRAEVENYRSTVAALDAEIARLKADSAFWEDTFLSASRRSYRYRSRLARVLRLVKEDRDWVGIHDGAVWSRRYASTEGDRKP